MQIAPARRAQTQSAPWFIQQGTSLARSGNIPSAVKSFQTAFDRDPNLETDSQIWNSLCWFGNLEGSAPDVLFACKKAIELAPEHGGHRDSRGVAKVLTGDINGAIEAFEAFVLWTDNDEQRQQRQSWIQSLQANQNPFTPDVLESFKDQ